MNVQRATATAVRWTRIYTEPCAKYFPPAVLFTLILTQRFCKAGIIIPIFRVEWKQPAKSQVPGPVSPHPGSSPDELWASHQASLFLRPHLQNGDNTCVRLACEVGESTQ